MSLILNSLRTIAHTSIMGAAPALSIGASKLARTNFHAIHRTNCSTIVRSKLPPRAVTVLLKSPPKLRAHRMRPMSARPVYQRQVKILTVVSYRRARRSHRPTFWDGFFRGFDLIFKPFITASLLILASNWSVTTTNKASVKSSS